MAYQDKEAAKEYQKKYRQEHKEYYQKYYQEHREKLKKYQKEYQKEYYKLNESQRRVRKRLTAEEREQQQLWKIMEKEREQAALDKLASYGLELEDMKMNCTLILRSNFDITKPKNNELFESMFNRHERKVEKELKGLVGQQFIYISDYNKRNKPILHRELYLNKCIIGDLLNINEEVYKILSDFTFYQNKE